MLAVVHISTLAGARDALEAGADGLAHVFADHPATEALATLAAKKHAFVVPTLSVNASVYGPSSGPTLAKNGAVSPSLSATASSGLMQTFPLKFNGDFSNAKAAVATLAAHGVPILAGTDAPNPGTAHGASMQAELALLVEAGLTPLQALAAATSAPARWSVYGVVILVMYSFMGTPDETSLWTHGGR